MDTSQSEKNSNIVFVKNVDEKGICCPPESKWNLHPRVFLTTNEQGKASCPYCGTCYQVIDDKDV